ncbi:type IV-A pilus assembly ATPase PilB [Entomomonas moraniae]|uniref:Type IV-A pilus assembly ATPase PilB n=1 Tax=Entomomonas moraniae TaxID=2213226 RepID=A0A3Q9JHL4_9GAMM|nr:type IV-A pilus assembly ATPase PilB [Entomomonas moraniae]AZS49689.1 type IV-A pilus assembly ATPase PilB [Entomomonas moraniae]
MNASPQALTGLAKIFADSNLLSESDLHKAVEQAKVEHLSLVNYLVQNKKASAKALAAIISERFGLPLFDLSSLSIDTALRTIITEKLARKHRVIPLWRRGNNLFIGISDPANQQGLKDIQFNTGLPLDAILIEDDKLTSLLDRFFDEGAEQVTTTNLTKTMAAGDEEKEDESIVNFVNQMLLMAIRSGASDLHFEPYEKSYRVRFRTDGILQIKSRPPLELASRISARLKVMSNMDISERRKPQDGRIKLKVSERKSIDFRVNSCPTLWGEKIVLRILDSSSAQLGIDQLGYEPDQKQLYLDALGHPQGMILVTGPTGSGKTVSLYTGLNILNTPDINISTAEDPVEINLEGINQVNVNPRQGLDFSSALRAFLRQDPDIIMVGEIRDLETAEIAIKAAQTGHMVMSTLHTNSAPETLTRLMNMGVAAFNLATSVNLIIAQRLARRLCGHCKEELELPKEVLIKAGFPPEKIGTFSVFGPKGCDRCNNGYKGRVGIYEVVKITPALQRIIMAEGNSIEIADEARKEGFDDLRTSGLKKVMAGLTSLEEVNRVTSD